MTDTNKRGKDETNTPKHGTTHKQGEKGKYNLIRAKNGAKRAKEKQTKHSGGTESQNFQSQTASYTGRALGDRENGEINNPI